MSANPLPVTLTANYTTERDDAGPYFPIRMGGKMIAYANDKDSAELIVAALNAATTGVVLNLAAQGSGYAQ